ncbi:uncharacterized protein [Temnothorax nylanderi]|uniref:uncharacterized protein n=1 Tax=Temnothorax nylanderi TaxID=102681 RepID=UPI003A84F004
MRDYEALNHMKKAPPFETTRQRVYLPHHATIKETSQTTKVRVVFNASKCSSNTTSLNDFLMVGPKLQANLFAVILRWRSHRYVYTTDIEKMFRQIRVHPEDVEYQCIFWRAHPNAELIAYWLLTVTYGTGPAPFLANRSVKQLAKDEGEKFPLAVPILEEETYVDDIMFGAEDLILLKQTRDQLIQLLKAGGFRPYKWASNDPRLLQDIPEADHGLAVDKHLGDDSSLRVLGIVWNPNTDSFQIHTHPTTDLQFTKRSFLSLLSRVFDPLGWVAPVTITAKIIMQSLWLRKIEWDEPLPNDLLQRCLGYQAQLADLSKISIPRWTGQDSEVQDIEIHGFSDASNSAYAAVVYLRVASMGSVRISILYAKTKIAPLKVQSVPRLELLAAALLARSIKFARESMKLVNIPEFCWTDSEVVRAWLNATPGRWKPFVANRVSEIHSTLPLATWRHVPTQLNPADCASRGISADELISHKLWWTGPPWLQGPREEWPLNKTLSHTDTNLEQRAAHVHTGQTRDEWNLLADVSSWPKLLRITAYIHRFLFNVRHPLTKKQESFLSASEIKQAKITCIRTVQKSYFDKEILALKDATRAIHLEVADDYTSDGFLAAFNRFTARRGLPAIIYSDNGTNFQGADKELTRRIREILRDPDIQNHFASDEISWNFIPPAAPQFGGLWEAGVKSVKFHLKRILGDFTPTFAEFTTLLCNIECILNSRPIALLYDDPESFDTLTPGHFLAGLYLKAVPSPSVGDINLNRLSRWQTVQRLQERFWKIWSSDYLNSLQQRKKWQTRQINLKIGDLVLLRNPSLPPTKWNIGRVLQCHTGDDDLVRVVTIKTARSTLKRPVTQLCKLPVESDNDEPPKR